MNSHVTTIDAPMKLYSAWYCPFAQRAWMTLLCKGIAFEYVAVDPYQTSDWWLDISRGRGKVPVIVTPDKGGRGSLTVIDSTRVFVYRQPIMRARSIPTRAEVAGRRAIPLLRAAMP